MGQREARHGADWGRLAPGRVGIMWGSAPRTGKAPYLAHCLRPRVSPQIPLTMEKLTPSRHRRRPSAMESIVKHDHLPRISQPRIRAGQTRAPPPWVASGREAAASRAKAADFVVPYRPWVAVEAPSRRAVSSAYQTCSRRGGSVPALLVHFSYVANAKGTIAILPMTGQTEGLALRCCCAS